MNVIATEIPDVLIVEPKVFRDHRGYFFESYNARSFSEIIDADVQFVQDNHSRSVRGVLRGLHYQVEEPQGKLVRCSSGEVFDVAVDIRPQSATYGKWVGTVLSSENMRQLWIPPGLAHGFLILSEVADFLYKTTTYYAPQYERAIIWNDPDLGIDWPIDNPILSSRDLAAPSFAVASIPKA